MRFRGLEKKGDPASRKPDSRGTGAPWSEQENKLKNPFCPLIHLAPFIGLGESDTEQFKGSHVCDSWDISK